MRSKNPPRLETPPPGEKIRNSHRRGPVPGANSSCSTSRSNMDTCIALMTLVMKGRLGPPPHPTSRQSAGDRLPTAPGVFGLPPRRIPGNASARRRAPSPPPQKWGGPPPPPPHFPPPEWKKVGVLLFCFFAEAQHPPPFFIRPTQKAPRASRKLPLPFAATGALSLP